MTFFGGHAIECHRQGYAIARQDRIRDQLVSTLPAANFSQVDAENNFSR